MTEAERQVARALRNLRRNWNRGHELWGAKEVSRRMKKVAQKKG